MSTPPEPCRDATGPLARRVAVRVLLAALLLVAGLPLAARALGQTPGGTLRRIYAPLIRGSVATALLLVFVDCVKELPATLLLRPFNFNTLATRAHEQATLEKIADAAPSAILIIGVSLLAVALVAREMLRRR